MSNPTILYQEPIEQVQTVHIVFVHGFRGDHTTFQAFPSDLHMHLLPSIPGLQTWVYPTYKSAKPLSFAVSKFLTWLKSLPAGPIILAGHSMGGLLVAEAATDRSPPARRVVGVLAFDTPYLGMHPHVVVSGIASLFQKKEDPNDKGKKKDGEGILQNSGHGPPAPTAMGMRSERSVNDEEIVNFVPSEDAYPQSAISRPGDLSPTSMAISLPSYHSGRLTPPLSPRSTSPQSGVSAGGSSLLTSAMSFFKMNAEDPFVRFLNKHSDAPVAAMSRWVVEYFEFGWAMFDYPNLLDRYEKLENWDGDWVCFWTVTGGEEIEGGEPMDDNERPPTPRKRRRIPPPGEALENEFERAMRSAMQKEENRQLKEAKKQAEKEERNRERARRKEEEEQERKRKKEEEAQERERQKAADALEKERKKAAEFQQKERKAKEEAERKEKARLAKEEAKRAKEAAKAAKMAQNKGEGQSPKKEQSTVTDEDQPVTKEEDPPVTKEEDPPAVTEAQDSSYEQLPLDTSKGESTTHNDAAPILVVEDVDVSSKPDEDDTESDKDGKSVTGSFQTALETHNPGSGAPSPSHSRPSSPSPSRPPSSDHQAAHHFITLPGKLHPRCKKHWLKVRIAGVQDEVAAHCGLFIRSQNLEYERFVERVGDVVKAWIL